MLLSLSLFPGSNREETVLFTDSNKPLDQKYINALLSGDLSLNNHDWLYHVDRSPPCRTSRHFSTGEPKVAFNVF